MDGPGAVDPNRLVRRLEGAVTLTDGRKFTPRETLERVVGGGVDPEPYLRYLSDKLGVLAS